MLPFMKSKVLCYSNRWTHKIIICFLFFCNISFSRNGRSSDLFVFKPKYAKLKVLDKPADISDLQHCVKWNYSLLGRGVFLLNYERMFDPKMTIEVGFGITRRDLFYEAYKGRYYIENADLVPDVGIAIEGGVRFYPSDFEDFEGVYLSPMISYRKYNYTVEKVTSSYTYPVLPSSFNPGYNFLDIQLKFGYQTEDFFNWDLDVLTDLYVGFALRNSTAQYYKLENTGITTLLTPVTKRGQYPQALFGCKIAIPF